MVAAGMIKTANDFFNAAMIYQHRNDSVFCKKH